MKEACSDHTKEIRAEDWCQGTHGMYSEHLTSSRESIDRLVVNATAVLRAGQ